MKNVFTIVLFALAMLYASQSFAIISSAPAETAIQFSVADIMSMNAREFSEATGQKLNWKEKLGYSFLKGQLKKQVKRGEVQLNDSASFTRDQIEGSFNIGAFLLGLLAGLIGLIIVLAAFRDKKAWKWALLGWGIWIILWLAIVL